MVTQPACNGWWLASHSTINVVTRERRRAWNGMIQRQLT